MIQSLPSYYYSAATLFLPSQPIIHLFGLKMRQIFFVNFAAILHARTLYDGGVRSSRSNIQMNHFIFSSGQNMYQLFKKFGTAINWILVIIQEG